MAQPVHTADTELNIFCCCCIFAPFIPVIAFSKVKTCLLKRLLMRYFYVLNVNDSFLE